MKFFLTFFDTVQNRPAYKFFCNFFILKNNQYYSVKYLNYIHLFYNVTTYMQIKLFKFNYVFYTNFIIYFILLNCISQVMLLSLYY
jgi:hypothetical protein